MAWFRKTREKVKGWEQFPFVAFTTASIITASVATVQTVSGKNGAVDLGTLRLLAVAAIVAAWYALETFRLRKETERTTKLAERTAKATAEANTFSALTTIHQQLENHDSRTLRRFVIEEARTRLGEALANNVGETYVTGASPNRTVLLERVLNTLQSNDEMATAFLAALNRSAGQSALVAIESVLADFDLIAVPHSLGIDAAQVAAETYKPIFEHTRRPLLEFVAIRRKLTGDSTYRLHYVRLLRELKIDTLGVA